MPDVVAAGEMIGPGTTLKSFVMIAELTGCEAVNEALPRLAARLSRDDFEALKRRLATEIAQMTAAMHRARAFHRDLYLCHFFLSDDRLGDNGGPLRLSLIDLHRLSQHAIWPDWWRWKDLGQLLFSTYDVEGINDRDRSRFWRSYCRKTGIRWPRGQARMIRLRAARYRAHNRKPR